MTIKQMALLVALGITTAAAILIGLGFGLLMISRRLVRHK